MVREGVLAGISTYVNSLTSSETRTWTVANSLTVQLNDAWSEIYSASGQEIEGYSNELGTGRSIQIESTSLYGSQSPDQAIFGEYSTYTKTGDAPSVTIGGRTPDYSTSFSEPTTPTSYGNVWCFTSEGVCVFYRGAHSLTEAQPSAALQEVFTTATWSS